MKILLMRKGIKKAIHSLSELARETDRERMAFMRVSQITWTGM